MTPLRRRMIDDMTFRNFTPKTIQAYVRCVARFARYFPLLTRPTRLGTGPAPSCSIFSESGASPSATLTRPAASCAFCTG